MVHTTAFVTFLGAQILLAQAGLTPASTSAATVTSGGEQIVTIERITVKGSRLSVPSIQFLSGLRPGIKVNEAGVRKAAQKIADSGLVQNVGYQYESLSSALSVELEFTIADEIPLLPASIQVPDVDAEDVWSYLRGIDPVFTRELPRTQKAIAFYTRAMERYFVSQKRMVRLATVITADAKGDASGIVFVPASLLGTPQLRGSGVSAASKQ